LAALANRTVPLCGKLSSSPAPLGIEIDDKTMHNTLAYGDRSSTFE
jgi:hypothetical protein